MNPRKIIQLHNKYLYRSW